MIDFAKEQQRLIDEFVDKAKGQLIDAVGRYYSDVTPYAETDAHLNFKTALWDEVYEDFENEITSEYNWFSRAGTLRANLLKNHRETLQNKIIQDLESKIERLQKEISQLHQRYR